MTKGKIVRSSDWTTVPMPEKHEAFQLKRHFSAGNPCRVIREVSEADRIMIRDTGSVVR